MEQRRLGVLGGGQLGRMMAEAAHRLGYPDQYQFSRAFKRVFGIAPAEFRRGHKIATHSAG